MFRMLFNLLMFLLCIGAVTNFQLDVLTRTEQLLMILGLVIIVCADDICKEIRNINKK
jgi:hypothetical protein